MRNKKTVIYVSLGIILVILMAIIFFSFDNDTNNDVDVPPVTSKVILEEERVDVPLGSAYQLILSLTDITDLQVEYQSSDSSIVSVDHNGLLLGNKMGFAVISVSYTDVDGKKYSDSCEVFVYQGNINNPLKGLSFSEGELVLTKGKSYNLSFITEPVNAYITDISYETSDSLLVSVNDNGMLNALNVGRVLIKVFANNKAFSDELYVNVIERDVEPLYILVPESIKFSTDKIESVVGKALDLDYEFSPNSAHTSYFSWSSSNETVASVEDGVVMCKSVGETSIKVTALNGVSDEFTLVVKNPYINVENIIVPESSINLYVGKTYQINPTITPSNASNPTITYSSSDTSIANVSNVGVIVGNKTGQAIITLTADTKQVTITVNVIVDSNGSGSSGGGSSNNVGSSYGRICLSYKTNYDPSSVSSSCGKSAQSLLMYLNGQPISKDSRHTIKLGETITITVKLPTTCGTPLLLIRNNHDGEETWRNYVKMSSYPNVNRYNTGTYVQASQYTWKIEAIRRTQGYITLSQTAEQCTKVGTIKSMTRFKLKIE